MFVLIYNINNGSH